MVSRTKIDGTSDRQTDMQRDRLCRTESKNDGLSTIFVKNSGNVNDGCSQQIISSGQ